MFIKPVITTVITIALGACATMPAQASPLYLNIDGAAIHATLHHQKKACKGDICHITGTLTMTHKGNLQGILNDEHIPLKLKPGQSLSTSGTQICQFHQRGMQIIASCDLKATYKAGQ